MLEDLYLLSQQYLSNKNQIYKRSCLDKNFLTSPLSILIGQRGVGKTTIIVQQLLQQVNNDLLSADILYIPADHFLLGKCALYEIAEQFHNLGGKIIAFDEIHKYQNWSQELKSIRDTFPKLKVIASGSSALEIYKGSHDLTRRAVVYSIKGLSFREYLELDLDLALPSYRLDEILEKHEQITNGILDTLNKKQQKVLFKFSQYLQTGYFPYFLEIPDKNMYWLTLEQNFHTIIESDLPAIHPELTGNSIKKIKQLLTFIATEVPFTPQWKKIKTILDVGDERTLKIYCEYLEDAGLIRLLTRNGSKMSTLEIQEKIYLDNPNQLFAISPNKQNIGTIREIFFLDMLSYSHKVTAVKTGDFLVDGKNIFEVGGKNKSFEQIKGKGQGYLACDQIEKGIGKRIPLWLFGFAY